MKISYISKYGKLVKQCPGLHQYWYKGRLIAEGSSLSSANPEVKPSSEDWKFCVSLRPEEKTK